MDIEDSKLYFNYRIILEAKSEGYLKPAFKQNEIARLTPMRETVACHNFENNDFYPMLKTKVENEINLLDKFKIKPVKTSRLVNCGKKQSISPALPKFLHIYDQADIFDGGGCLESKIRTANGVFLTSSRFKDAKIYKPGGDILNNLDKHLYNASGNAKFDFICIGTNSEAETEFIKKFSGNLMPIILPAYSLLSSAMENRIRSDFPQISALDPFAKISKYGLALRNSLAFHLSQETAILYLSEKSSLSGFIKKFRDAGKKVKILERERPYGSGHKNANHRDGDANNTARHDAVQQFIMNSLEKENIAIDNLLKLSNIKLNADEKETVKAISILEMNCEIERCPGGIIKKI